MRPVGRLRARVQTIPANNDALRASMATNIPRHALNESPASRGPLDPNKRGSCAVLTRKLAFSVLAVAGVLSTMLLPCQALAQDPAPAGAANGASQPASASAQPRSSSGRKRISLDDEFLVEGKLEKPSAFFVFKRSAVDYDWARLDAQFAPLVLESVQDPLF